MNKYYRNIEGILSSEYYSDMIKNMTDSDKIELFKCDRSINYLFNKHSRLFSNEVFKFITPKSTIFQDILFEKCQDSQFLLVSNKRQSGLTIGLVACVYNYILYNCNKTISIFDHNNGFREKFISFIKLLPDFLKLGVSCFNETQIRFSNGTRIRFHKVGNAKSFALGYSPDFVVVDEYSYYKDEIKKMIISNIIPILSARTNSKLIIGSTPSSTDSYFKYLNENEILGFEKIFNNKEFIKMYGRNKRIEKLLSN